MEDTPSQGMTSLSAYLQTWKLKFSNTKSVTAAFYLHSIEAKRALNVYNNGKLLPPCPVPTYLGVKLDRSLTFRHHREALRKKLSTRVALLRRLAGSGCGADAKTLHISALSLVYPTAEYWAPTEDLLVLAGIQPTELRRLGATLFLANCAIHDPDYVLHRQLVGQQDAYRGRLRSRRPFVPAAWKLLGSLSKLDIRVKQWTKHKWNAD